MFGSSRREEEAGGGGGGGGGGRGDSRGVEKAGATSTGVVAIAAAVLARADVLQLALIRLVFAVGEEARDAVPGVTAAGLAEQRLGAPVTTVGHGRSRFDGRRRGFGGLAVFGVLAGCFGAAFGVGSGGFGVAGDAPVVAAAGTCFELGTGSGGGMMRGALLARGCAGARKEA